MAKKPKQIAIYGKGGISKSEAFPDADQAKVYQNLAERIANHSESKVPEPLDVHELRKSAAEWSDQILAIETGEVRSTGQSI
jgi:nitrogenase iron protein NifH